MTSHFAQSDNEGDEQLAESKVDTLHYFFFDLKSTNKVARVGQ